MLRNIVWRAAIVATPLILGTFSCKEPKNQIYMWGNGNYQARPDAILQFQNFYPKKVENLPNNLVSLHFGEFYQAGIDKKGQLYIWDKQPIDSNYEQNLKDNRRQNIKMIQKDVKSIKFTSGYVWTLDNNGKVHQFAILKKYDNDKNLVNVALGDKKEVQPLRGTVQLDTGRDHLIALSSTGQVWAMGDDTYGQCGHTEAERNTFPPFPQRRIKYPIKIKNLSEIVKIAAGEDHNLVLDKLGHLYGWGSNSSLQISHEQQFSKLKNPLICSDSPLRISKNLENLTIKNIVAGGQFSLVITENKLNGSNEVYTFGSNLRGQLGVDEVKHLKDVSKVQKLSNYIIKDKKGQKKVIVEHAQCGKNHCIVLLNIGYIMQWGDNQYGQLGNKKRSPSLAPIIVRDFIGKKIVNVFAGENSSGVIVEEN